MRLHALLFCATLLVGCSSPMHRPITEEIPLDEMNRVLKDKPDFGAVVLLTETFRSRASTLDMARANDLTYSELYDFLKSYTDDELRNRLTQEGEEQWRDLFGSAYNRTDSIIDQWQHYLDENKPDSYVNVELKSILPEESIYGTAEVVIAVSPAKGPVDKVEGSFGIFPRDRSHSFGDFSSARHNNFSFDQGLRAAATCQTWMNYSIWDITDGDIPYNMYPDRPGLPLNELLEKYCFDYTITTLVKNGKQIRFLDIYNQIPASVQSYWNSRDEEQNDEYLRGNIVRELVNPAFTESAEYIREYQQDYFCQQNQLAAWIVFERL